MHRIHYAVLGVLLTMLVVPAFYAQQELTPTVESPAQSTDQLPTLLPSDPSMPQSVDQDPLLGELTELFLKDKDTSRGLTYHSTDGSAEVVTKSSSEYFAAELLLKAARVLEQEHGEKEISQQQRQQITKIRSLAKELLLSE